MKKVRWTEEDHRELDVLQASGMLVSDIAEKMGRSRDSIIIKINQTVETKIRVCLDCNIKIIGAHFNRERCPECSKKHTAARKKITGAAWYDQNGERTTKRRAEERFGGNREKIMLRDKEQCTVCGFTREEHKLKYKTDLLICSKDMSKRVQGKPKTDMDSMETLCVVCQGKKRATKRVQDWSMCGGQTSWKKRKENLEKNAIKMRCQQCGELNSLYFDPIKYKDRFLRKVCKYCNKRMSKLPIKKKINFNIED